VTVQDLGYLITVLTPIIIALLKHRSEKRHKKALDIVVRAIDKGDDTGQVKGIVEEETQEMPEGDLIKAIVDKYRVPKEPTD